MSSKGSPERVLVVGDDMRIFLAVVRSLGRAGKEVHAAPFNWHSPALKSKYITRVHRFPRYSDNPLAWRDAVVVAVRDYGFELIVPCCDRAILPLDAHREDFAATRLALPSSELISLFFDKERTRELCVQLGVPVADGLRLGLEHTAGDLVRRFGLPLVVKPRKSFWIDRLDAPGKVWIVESEAELQHLLATLPDRSRYLVENHFDGIGVGVSVLAHDGRILQAFQHRRLRQGKGGNSSHRVSESCDPRLAGVAEKVCARTNLTGVCMFEFRCNLDTREFILIETNARFWGSSPLPLSLGVDFPRLLYELLVHGIEHPPVEYTAGVKCRNVVLDGHNLLREARELGPGRIGPWAGDVLDFITQPYRWLSGRERSDTFVRDDVAPALWEFATLGKSLGQKLTRDRMLQPRRRHGEQAVST